MAVRELVKEFGRPVLGRHGGRSGVRAGIFNIAVAAALLVAGPSAATEPIHILMLGDSLTAGSGLIKSESLPVRLEAALEQTAPGVRVINGGVSGDTTAGGRARLAWSLAERPNAVIIALGANDGLRGLAPKQTYANLDAIISAAKDAGVAVLLAGMRAPPNHGPAHAAAADALRPHLAAEPGAASSPCLLEGVVARPEFNQADGNHPNARGVDIIVANMLPLVRDLIARIGR